MDSLSNDSNNFFYPIDDGIETPIPQTPVEVQFPNLKDNQTKSSRKSLETKDPQLEEKEILLNLLHEPPKKRGNKRTSKQAKKATIKADIQHDHDVYKGTTGNPINIDSDPSAISMYSSSDQRVYHTPEDDTTKLLPPVDNINFEPQSSLPDFKWSSSTDNGDADICLPYHTNSSPILSELSSWGSPVNPILSHTLKEKSPREQKKNKFTFENWQDQLDEKLGDDFEITIKTPPSSSEPKSSSKPNSLPLQPQSANSANTPKTSETPQQQYTTDQSASNTGKIIRKTNVSLPRKKQIHDATTDHSSSSNYYQSGHAEYPPSSSSSPKPADPGFESDTHYYYPVTQQPNKSSSGSCDENALPATTTTTKRSIATKLRDLTFRRQQQPTSYLGGLTETNEGIASATKNKRFLRRVKKHIIKQQEGS